MAIGSYMRVDACGYNYPKPKRYQMTASQEARQWWIQDFGMGVSNTIIVHKACAKIFGHALFGQAQATVPVEVVQRI